MRQRRRKIEQLVSELLQTYKVQGPPVPVKRVARSLGLEIQMQTFKKGEVSGILVREGNRAVLGLNAADHRNRQRFTIAHEIGHFLLHEGDRVFVDRSYNVSLRSSISSLGTDLEEIEANTFASLLLMPEEFLVKDLQEEEIDIDDLKGTEKLKKLVRRYRVSPQAMSFRLINRSAL